MKRNNMFVLAAALIISLAAGSAFSEDADEMPAQTKADVPSQIPQEDSTPIYGEVQSVNISANAITIQYYDYDSDEEKAVEIIADKDTKLEHVTAIAEIKKGDWVDIVFNVADGKNMAKSISVEKEEAVDVSGETELPPAETSTEE